MPAPSLGPLPDDLYPVWEPKAPRKPTPLTPTQARAVGNKRLEDAAGSVPVIGGVLRQGQRFLNVLASPDTKAGIFTGPVNGISKLGNALKAAGFRKDYTGALSLWNPSGFPTQSISILEAGAEAYAQVLKDKLGLDKVYAGSRMD